jgi:hypothetical protein
MPHLVLIPAISAWLLFLNVTESFRVLGLTELLALLWSLTTFAFCICKATMECSQPANGVHPRAYIGLIADLLFLRSGFPKAAQFALVFLLFTIPIPDFLLDKLIYSSKGTTEITAVLFD